MLQPEALDVTSRFWAWYVNEFAASPLVRPRERSAIYRHAGLDVATEWIMPKCYFHTSMITIGAGAKINHGCHIENVAPVEIGERAGMGVHTTILTSDHEIAGPEQRDGTWLRKPVKIGAGSWVGARSMVLPGVTVGNGCLVAAGAVVTKDCEPNGLYAGVPARRIRDLPG